MRFGYAEINSNGQILHQMAKFMLRCTVETTQKLQFAGAMLLIGGVISER